jgi:uncharacterized membrane protein
MQNFSTVQMQPTFQEIKLAAKSSLKHRWPEAIAVTVVFLATALLNLVMQSALMTIFKVDNVWSPFSPTDVPFHNIVAGFCITIFSAVFSLSVMFPLIYGVMRWFWLVTGGGDPSLSEIFYYFSSFAVFKKAVLVSIGLFIRLVIGAVLSFLPYVILNVVTLPDFYTRFSITMQTWVDRLTTLIPVLEVMGFLFLMFWVSLYAMFYTVMFNNPTQSAHSIIRASVKMTRNRRVRFVVFALSFLGWFLLNTLVIPLVFTMPYFMASLAVYGREVYRSALREPNA